MLANGQTTLCEAWGCNSHDSDNGSFNHIMLVPSRFHLSPPVPYKDWMGCWDILTVP